MDLKYCTVQYSVIFLLKTGIYAKILYGFNYLGLLGGNEQKGLNFKYKFKSKSCFLLMMIKQRKTNIFKYICIKSSLKYLPNVAGTHQNKISRIIGREIIVLLFDLKKPYVI